MSSSIARVSHSLTILILDVYKKCVYCQPVFYYFVLFLYFAAIFSLGFWFVSLFLLLFKLSTVFCRILPYVPYFSLCTAVFRLFFNSVCFYIRSSYFTVSCSPLLHINEWSTTLTKVNSFVHYFFHLLFYYSFFLFFRFDRFILISEVFFSFFFFVKSVNRFYRR